MGKAIQNEIVIDYYEWDGNSDGLQIWMDGFKEKVDNFFNCIMLDEEDILELKLPQGRRLEVIIGNVLIRGTIEGSADYSVISAKQFKENYTKNKK